MIHLISELPMWTTSLMHWNDVAQMLHWPGSDDWMVLAQQFKQTDIVGDVGKTWSHFVKTGQVWAFLIGIVAGYMVKTFTSYG
jgi:hypothetical protein